MATFIEFIAGPPPAPILNTPPKVNPPPNADSQTAAPTTQRKSSRLADKAKLHPGKDSIQLAQRVLVNKLGELSPNKHTNALADFNTLLQHLPQALMDTEMVAIQTLIEHGNKPKSRKKSKVVPAPQGGGPVGMEA
ncbi:unnamed protein product [Urochloa humidicola]